MEIVLRDSVMHKMWTSSELDGIVSLELAAGTGIFITNDLVLSCSFWVFV